MLPFLTHSEPVWCANLVDNSRRGGGRRGRAAARGAGQPTSRRTNTAFSATAGRSRTRGHVFSCLLALKICREMERRLRARFGATDSNPHAVTLPDTMVSLSRLCLLHYPVNDSTSVTRLPSPDARQTEILAAFGVTLPAM